MVSLASTRLDDALAHADAWRTPFRGAATAGGKRKEWMHFCVGLPSGGHLLVNLSVVDDTAGRRTPRLIALAWNGAWTGDVLEFEQHAVSGSPGPLNVRLGENVLAWDGRAFRLSLRAATLAAELELCPVTLPTVATSVALGPTSTLSWVVAPRLLARGWVRLDGRTFGLEGALAYHDHNWGDFRWGGELSWEWGFFLPRSPASPWSLVLARVGDGAGGRVLSQTALVWRERRLVRVFQNREIDLSFLAGKHRAQPFTIPKVARFLAPGSSSGVPSRVRARATSKGDAFELEYQPTECARVALPSEVDPFRLVSLNETSGPALIRGQIGSEAIELEANAMMEFVHGG